MALELYPRKCSKTGEGFNKGWKIGDEYAISIEIADEYARELGSVNFDDLYETSLQHDTDFAYWSEWEDTDILEQGFGYTESGQEIQVSIDE